MHPRDRIWEKREHTDYQTLARRAETLHYFTFVKIFPSGIHGFHDTFPTVCSKTEGHFTTPCEVCCKMLYFCSKLTRSYTGFLRILYTTCTECTEYTYCISNTLSWNRTWNTIIVSRDPTINWFKFSLAIPILRRNIKTKRWMYKNQVVTHLQNQEENPKFQPLSNHCLW